MVAAQTIATISIRVPDPVWDLVCRAACAHLLDGWRGRTSWFTRWMELSPCVLFCWPSGTCFDDKGFSRSLNLKGRHARGYGSRTADVACGVQSCSRSLRLGSSRVSSCGSCNARGYGSRTADVACGVQSCSRSLRLGSSRVSSCGSCTVCIYRASQAQPHKLEDGGVLRAVVVFAHCLGYFLKQASECGTRAHTRSERKQRGTKRQRLVTYSRLCPRIDRLDACPR